MLPATWFLAKSTMIPPTIGTKVEIVKSFLLSRDLESAKTSVAARIRAQVQGCVNNKARDSRVRGTMMVFVLDFSKMKKLASRNRAMIIANQFAR